MPDPFTDERMHELGNNAAAKWLFGVARRWCFGKNTPEVSREMIRSLCRQHEIAPDTIDVLLATTNEAGEPLFMEAGEEPGHYRLVSYWDDKVTSTDRTRAHRRRQAEAKAASEGRGTAASVADGTLAALAEVGAANLEVLGTVPNSSQNFGTDGEELRLNLGTVPNSSPYHSTTEHPRGETTNGSGSATTRARTREEPVPPEWIGQVFETWKATLPAGARRNLSPQRKSDIHGAIVRVAKQLRAAGSQRPMEEALQLCLEAVRGWRYDDWSRRPQVNDLEDCLRPGNIERFADWERGINRPSGPGGPGAPGHGVQHHDRHEFDQWDSALQVGGGKH